MSNHKPHCYLCGDRNPENFYKDKSRRSGYASRCKPCNTAATAPLRKLKPTSITRLADDQLKTCPRCPIPKPASAFYVSDWRAGGRTSYCKECFAAVYQSNKDRIKFQRILVTFGITETEYNEMLIRQDGKCAICLQPETSSRFKFLAVDHCHNTGQIRGLLCSRCNIGLGQFRDNAAIIQRASSYLSA